MKNTNTYSRLEHQHFGVGGGEERAGLAKVEDSEIGPRHVMPLSSRHISFMERVDIFLPWKVTWTEGWSILGKTISSRVCPLDSASARLHLFCHLLHGLPWSLLLLGSTTKKNRFRISSPFPCIIYCHKDVESSFFLEMGYTPIFENSWKPWRKKLSCSLKGTFWCHLSIFHSWTHIGSWDLPKKRTRFGQFGTPSPEHRLQSTPQYMETPPGAGVLVEFVLLTRTSSCWSVAAERGFSCKLLRSHGVNCNQSASQQAWESPLLIAPAVTSNIDRTVWGICIFA